MVTNRYAALRVLFLGENWYGSCARACCYALRRLGCDVMDIDCQTFSPQWSNRAMRLGVRLIRPLITAEYAHAIEVAAARFHPNLLLAFKGHSVHPHTLERLRAAGIALYNYYPDTSAFAHGPLLKHTLPLYDCVFYTKPFWDANVRARISLRDSVFLPHGYDPEVHTVPGIQADDFGRYQHDVTVVATYTAHKERSLKNLLSLLPDLDLAIFGNQWTERCKSAAVRSRVRGFALTGTQYAKAIHLARINLALLSGRVPGASQGDETTTRSFEIPACGGFMLHERTPEILNLYEEGHEVACFGDPREIAEKIMYYLGTEGERQRIAVAGHARCVPSYSYISRMQTLLEWHLRRSQGERCVSSQMNAGSSAACR